MKGLRKIIEREKSGFGQFVIRKARAGLAEIIHQKQGDMITARDTGVKKYPEQFWWRGQGDIAFFNQLPGERLYYGFFGFNTATRKVPAGHISVTHQKDPTLQVKYASLSAQCHAAGKAKIGVIGAAAQADKQ